MSAHILLDGADLAFMHLIQEIPADEVRMGMRVEAVWARPRSGAHAREHQVLPAHGEPDADYETYKEHL